MSYRLMVVAVASPTLRNLPQHLGDTVSVQLFESADEALWEMRTNPPEVLIAEVDLPGMSGIELAEIIPNFEVATRVVLYSPADESARPQAEAAGVYRFLHGPLSAEELAATLHAAGQAARPAAGPALPPAPAEQTDEAPPAPPAETPSAEPEASPAEQPAPRPRADFTPARVVLPPVAERTTVTAPAPPGRSSLAARSKAAAERAPGRSASGEPATPSWRSSGGNLVVTEQNISTIRAVMSQLSQDLGAQSVLLTDRAGMVLVEVGTAANLPMMIVLPLLSTGFSTTGEVARQLRESDATSVYIHEGVNIDLYCFDVMQRFLLVLVFNKQVASSKIGAVWINAKRAIRDLREAFKR